jgi:hypothetical protein
LLAHQTGDPGQQGQQRNGGSGLEQVHRWAGQQRRAAPAGTMSGTTACGADYRQRCPRAWPPSTARATLDGLCTCSL